MAHGDPAFSFLVSNLSSNRPNSIDPALLMCGRDEVPALERCGTSHPVPLNSISVPDDLVCPICFEVAALPVITECSHVFCIRCIISSLAHHVCYLCFNQFLLVCMSTLPRNSKCHCSRICYGCSQRSVDVTIIENTRR